jgi:hypothetical protein
VKNNVSTHNSKINAISLQKRESSGPQQFKSNGYTRNGPVLVVDEASNDISLQQAITNDDVLPEQTEVTKNE